MPAEFPDRLNSDQSTSSLMFDERTSHAVQTSLTSPTWRPMEPKASTARGAQQKATHVVATTTTTQPWSASALSNPLLPVLWAGDVVIALSVTASVAPALTIVDKAIVEQSARSGKRGVLLTSMKRTAASISSNPIGYFRSAAFGWMWLTYAATYTTANFLKTWNEQHPCRSVPTDSATSSSIKAKGTGGTLLVAGTTIVNSGASLVKDRAYARMFGQSPRPVPAVSYLSWIARDGVVIGSSFVLPAYVTPLIQEATGLSSSTSETVSQLFTPMAAQLVAGPLHLWGLTLYNANAEKTLYQKLQSWRSGLSSVTGARMLRILPGYGVAGVINKKSRVWWKRRLLEAQIRGGNQQVPHMVALIRSLTMERT